MELSYMRKYDHFMSHLSVLLRAPKEDLSNEFIVSGIIDKFFIQFELGWKLLKEMLAYDGKSISASGSPRSIIKTSYECYDFIEEEIWLDMLRDRNDMTHIYNKSRAMELVNKIIQCYIPAFERMGKAVQEWKKWN